MPIAPLRFEPIFTDNLWGGRSLRPFFGRPPVEGPTGEAWVLSDVDGSLSVVANGPFKGRTLRDVLALHATDILGDVPLVNGRFPLLIKFIDARSELSVQVHPNDVQAKLKHPTAAGKTEAWVVCEANPATSRIYAGFNPGMTPARFRAALVDGTAPATLYQYVPRPGDCVFLEAGTVHAIGRDLVVFEVQQTSDITYRLYDWDRVDAKTGLPRELHLEAGLACSDFAKGPCNPVTPVKDGERERLVHCDYFELERWTLERPMPLPAGNCRVLTVLEGTGALDDEPLHAGATVLVPATADTGGIVPKSKMVVMVATPRAKVS